MLSSAAMAQSGPGLLLKPGPADKPLEFQANVLRLLEAETDNEVDLDLTIVESDGRWRFLPAQPLGPSVGYEVMYLDFDTDHAAVPERLVDVSIAGGSAFAKSGDWWFAATAGVGYAGESPFADNQAWYGKASIIIGRELWGGILVGIIDYNGNRAIFPDVPLPGLAITKQVSPHLSYVIGIPYSSLTWKPTPELRVDLRYTLPETIDVAVQYDLTPQISILGSFDNRLRAFHLDDLPSDRRIFFEQSRAELGVKYSPMENLGILVAGGYAFGQELSTGFDARDLDEITEISDEPYIRVGVEFRP